MPKVKQQSLEDKQKQTLIRDLARIGQTTWHQNWRSNMALPDRLDVNDRESTVRFLLLRALLNQQGDTMKVREFVRELFAEFGDALLHDLPAVEQQFERVLKVFFHIGGERGSKLYRVGSLGGIKPLSLFLYRFAAFSLFIKRLDGSLYKLVRAKLKESVNALVAFLRDDPILDSGWVGNDPKACRMLVNWLVWLFAEVWRDLPLDLSQTLMVVDGHVGKVFCRTGLLDVVSYKEGSSIINAKEMRNAIEALVRTMEGVEPFFVDEGAFHIAMNWCQDIAPCCSNCPLQSMCLAGQGSTSHLRWTAYREWQT